MRPNELSPEFIWAANYVLGKNADLYRRLATGVEFGNKESMSVLAQIYVADPSQAVAKGIELDEVTSPDCLEVKSVTDLNLSMLWAIMQGVDWTTDHSAAFETMLNAENGPWLSRLPIELVHLLTGADEEIIGHSAVEWARTVEMAGWEPDDVRELMDDLVNLAWKAEGSNKSMYIRVTL